MSNHVKCSTSFLTELSLTNRSPPHTRSSANITLQSFTPSPQSVGTADLRENDCRNPSNPKSRLIPEEASSQSSPETPDNGVTTYVFSAADRVESGSFFYLQNAEHLPAGCGLHQESNKETETGIRGTSNSGTAHHTLREREFRLGYFR
ncbi:hypothetical protein Bca4012_018511 [Brassica carinata]